MTAAVSLESISIVLVKTSHPGNVGSVARAMKTMGLSDLRLVEPKTADICCAEEAISLASGAADVLESARIYHTLPDALADRSVAFALSARLRDLGPSLQSPQQAAREALHLTQTGVGAAFVFGAERTGLSNDELLVCNRQVTIAANPVYSSLNLSQAVQIVAYALRTEWASGLPDAVENSLSANLVKGEKLASVKAVADLQIHWLQAMEAVDFINPDKPKKVVQRLARMLAKTPLEQEEVDMLRGFFSDVIRVVDNRLYPHEFERKKP
ncbi:MAG: RNA methyltransferase [Gammaproteobacteria bacterium]|uniref:RNA methyltransferase n=1 Tax=Limnobacter sp. TaxID=2003368 RepID=UPI001D259EFC|nr:RNA methyltransferase [Limnobacter sp.]MBU0782906.1 RNA methyltransferase [Gammaproteobacteria bacterium]MBU0849493.1 RNA methyltransferase [Gammaproteobacteria bacterium]MBU1268092.1 RNA methyltransferase [Gammaproteobacteria bacterium]MBU1528956.1 RNA methyltransferase [Gammaproteobacteria bacterium]MBU1779486.1 RNA methyltransferase [Gammaproteobacteria bacterium]